LSRLTEACRGIAAGRAVLRPRWLLEILMQDQPSPWLRDFLIIGDLEFAVVEAPDSERVRILQVGGKHLLRKALKADGAGEAVDG